MFETFCFERSKGSEAPQPTCPYVNNHSLPLRDNLLKTSGNGFYRVQRRLRGSPKEPGSNPDPSIHTANRQ